MVFETHIHSKYSDGENTLKEICDYNYRNLKLDLIFSDHVNYSTTWFNKYKKELKSLKKQYPFDIKIGCEVKIMDNGELNAPDEILNEAEVIIGSVHNFSALTREEMYELSNNKLIEAEYKLLMMLAKHPKVNIIGHPFSMVLRKDPSAKIPERYLINIFEEVKRNKKIIEFNSKHSNNDMLMFYHKQFFNNKYFNMVMGSDAHSKFEIGQAYKRFNNTVNVLVTAAGSGVAQGILKSLDGLGFNIHACDCNNKASGLYFHTVNKRHIIPAVKDENKYISSLEKLVKKENIKLIFIGGDIEVPILAKYKDHFMRFGCKIIVSCKDSVMVGLNKANTHTWCEGNKVCEPEFYGVNNKEKAKEAIRKGKTVVIKPVQGWASNNVFTCYTEDDVDFVDNFLLGKNIPYLAQKFIKGRELTCGVVKHNGMVYGLICMERDIHKGTTLHAKVITDRRILSFVRSAAEKFNFEGECNFQLLDDGKYVYLMEINTRFSGTTGLRNMCGFKSVQELANLYIYGVEPRKTILNDYKIKSFVRYYNEVMLDGDDLW